MKITDKYVFFWGGILSNWADVPSKLMLSDFDNFFKGVYVPTSEHFFMAGKARLFRDRETFYKIIDAPTPKEAKKLGRGVKGFNQSLWDEKKEAIMRQALMEKANACEEFKETLLTEEWRDKHFVEASPYDKVWGIGMGEDDPDVNDESKWPGQNLLGKCLDSTRKALISQEWYRSCREHTWLEEIIYCPSQIYYFFKSGEQNYVVYLRWRWDDPWTAEIIPIRERSLNSDCNWEWDKSEKIPTTRGCEEWRFLEEEVLEVLRKKFPDVNFPLHPEIYGDD